MCQFPVCGSFLRCWSQTTCWCSEINGLQPLTLGWYVSHPWAELQKVDYSKCPSRMPKGATLEISRREFSENVPFDTGTKLLRSHLSFEKLRIVDIQRCIRCVSFRYQKRRSTSTNCSTASAISSSSLLCANSMQVAKRAHWGEGGG